MYTQTGMGKMLQKIFISNDGPTTKRGGSGRHPYNDPPLREQQYPLRQKKHEELFLSLSMLKVNFY